MRRRHSCLLHRDLSRCALFFALIFLAACSRGPDRIDRLAILRFENLSDDTSLNWIGRAFSDVIAAELSSAPDVYVIPPTRMLGFGPAFGVRPTSAPGISSERSLAFLAGANRIAYGQYYVRGGRLQARLTIEDPQTQKVSAVFETSSAPADVIGAASAIARRISRQSQPYSTGNGQALEAYVIASESRDLSLMTSGLDHAIALDAGYAEPYEMLAEIQIQQQNRAGAAATLDRALGSVKAPGEGHARLTLEKAVLSGDAVARRNALKGLLKFTPRDPTLWGSLGEMEMNHHDYRASMDAFRKSLAIEPENVTALNSLAYAAAYAGDPKAAFEALYGYQSLRPGDANALDSLGDVNLISGQLQQAQQFYVQAAKKNPNLLSGGDWLKAAMARLMNGNVAGGDEFAKQYIHTDLQRREWLWVTGRRREALEGNVPDPATAVIWSLLLGDRSAAARYASKTEGKTAEDLIARFLTASTTSDQLPPAMRDLAMSYSFLLDRRFAEAVPLLERLYSNMNPAADNGVAILLAWAYLETDHAADAAPLLRFNPVPPATGPGAFYAFYFPRLYELRARLAERQGDSAEAEKDSNLYKKLSGTGLP